jgi:hypothetical protein
MIRRVIVLFSVLAACLVVTSPVSVSASTGPTCVPGPSACSQTMHFSSVPLFAAPLPCSPLAGWNVINEDNGNGVFHITVNGAGDFWLTGTYTGDVRLQPAKNVVLDSQHNLVSWEVDSTRPTASGRVADWFGFSENKNNAVQHSAVNAQVTTSAGQSFNFHAVDHIQFDSAGNITHQFLNASCF